MAVDLSVIRSAYQFFAHPRPNHDGDGKVPYCLEAYARGEYIDKGGEVGHCYATYGVFEGERC